MSRERDGRDRGRGELRAAHRGRAGEVPKVTGAPPEKKAAGGDRRRGGRGSRQGKQRTEGAGREDEPLARLCGLEAFFKNAIWAHRTVYNACPVHTGQRTVAVR
jgi:hypothetical protein